MILPARDRGEIVLTKSTEPRPTSTVVHLSTADAAIIHHVVGFPVMQAFGVYGFLGSESDAELGRLVEQEAFSSLRHHSGYRPTP